VQLTQSQPTESSSLAGAKGRFVTRLAYFSPRAEPPSIRLNVTGVAFATMDAALVLEMLGQAAQK
jgi:hypothetical protein